MNFTKRMLLKELHNHNLVVFAGAGLSRPSGYVDWRTLLGQVAFELGVDMECVSDMTLLAQYYCNVKSRHQLNEIIIDELDKKAKFNLNMDILAKLPIYNFWTTNFDSVIEDTLRQNNKNVITIIEQSQLKYRKNYDEVFVYKMHGDMKNPDDTVITRDDYEMYYLKRGLFTKKLKTQLKERTFLFIGFSFSDPNFDRTLASVRTELKRRDLRDHYYFIRRLPEEKKEERIKRELMIDDLKRYGFNPIYIDEYEDITKFLNSLYMLFELSNIYIIGSAVDYGDWGRREGRRLLFELSSKLIEHNYNIFTGLGEGVEDYIINGAVTELYRNGLKQDGRVNIRPFPRDHFNCEKLLFDSYQEDSLNCSSISIFVFGNKENSGTVVRDNNIYNEYKTCYENGDYIIPVATTGYVAEIIMNEIENEKEKFWYLQESIDILKHSKNITEITDEIINIIGKIKRFYMD